MDNKVLDEAVEVLVTRLDLNPDYFGTEEIRESFLAGVKVLLGEPVAWQLIDTNGRPVFLPYLHKDEAESMVAFYQDDSQLRKQDQEVFTIRVLYAPSLGEGDGR